MKSLAQQGATKWFVTIVEKEFTYPFNRFGGGDASDRTYVCEKTVYMTATQAYRLLSKLDQWTRLSVGDGTEYHLVNE